VGVEDEKETLTQRVAEIGGKNRSATVPLDYHVGYTKGSYYKPYDYNSYFINPGLSTAILRQHNSTELVDRHSREPAGFNPLDPAGYTLSRLSNQRTNINDHEWPSAPNLAIPMISRPY